MSDALPLSPSEARVLGVLVEKAQTTQAQYPLSLNAVVSGCNQKSNRHPVVSLSEEAVFDTLEQLRKRELVRELNMSGSRVAKYRHTAREALDVSTTELVVLAELMLRGPQTLGEIRGRASRMHPLESLEVASNVLESLARRDTPLVERVAPAPGSRAGRFVQKLCPDLHPLDAAAPPATVSTAPDRGGELRGRLDRLEAELTATRQAVTRLASALGHPDPFADDS